MSKRHFIISTILHAAVILPALLMEQGLLDGKEGGKGSASEHGHQEGDAKGKQNGDIIPKHVEVTMVEREPEKLTDQNGLPITIPTPAPDLVKADGIKECEGDFWYGGIGISSYSGVIGDVADGYPAQKAGLLAGDIIRNKADEEIRGLPGTAVTLTIFRPQTQKTFSVTIVRDKICTKEKIK